MGRPLDRATSHVDSYRAEYGTGCLLTVLAVVAVILLVAGVFALRWYTADARGEMDARERTVADGRYRLANHDWFYDQCHAVRAAEGRIETTLDELNDETNPPSEARAGQLRINLGAQRNSRTDLIEDYNARASNEATRGQFRDDDLPHRIDPDQETTQCAFTD